MTQTALTTGKAAQQADKLEEEIARLDEEQRTLEMAMVKEHENLRKELEKLTAPKNWVKLEIIATDGKGKTYEVVAEDKNGFDLRTWNQMTTNAGRAIRDRIGQDVNSHRAQDIRNRLAHIPKEHKRMTEDYQGRKQVKRTQLRRLEQWLVDGKQET